MKKMLDDKKEGLMQYKYYIILFFIFILVFLVIIGMDYQVHDTVLNASRNFSEIILSSNTTGYPG